MVFQTLTLTPFRNHAHLTLSAGPGLQVLVGPNGAGKTTVLEALMALCLTKGRQPDAQLVPWQGDYFRLEASLSFMPEHETNMALAYSPLAGKKLWWEGQPQERMGAHIGRVPLVAAWPDDGVRMAEAQGRRRWLDGLLAQAQPEYLQHLQRYSRTLDQRNALLQAALERGGTPDATLLEAYGGVLAAAGSALVAARTQGVAQLAPVVVEEYAALTAAGERPELLYHTQASAEAVVFADTLTQSLVTDRAAGRTRYGPHRDDLAFVLKGQPLWEHASQGQRKTYLLALRLAERRWLARLLHKPPVLLLDDVLDKLDPHRGQALFHRLSEPTEPALNTPYQQWWLTDADPDRVQRLVQGLTLASLLHTLG